MLNGPTKKHIHDKKDKGQEKCILQAQPLIPCLTSQGCQIFLDTIYQNEGKYTKLPHHHQMAIKYTKLH
jgi:hypothetical protein